MALWHTRMLSAIGYQYPVNGNSNSKLYSLKLIYAFASFDTHYALVIVPPCAQTLSMHDAAALWQPKGILSFDNQSMR